MRSLSAGVRTAIAASVIRPAYLVSLEFGVTTVLYLSDRARSISWNSKTWQGNGWLRPIRTFQETSEVRATGCEITLTGDVTEIVALCLNDARLSNKGTVYLGFLDANEDLIADPYLVFRGTLDVPTIVNNGGELTITLSYESELRGLDRQNEFRYTDQSQQAIYPGDKGFEYVPLMEKWDGFWGKPERPKWLRRKRPS